MLLDTYDVAWTMTAILATMIAFLVALIQVQTPTTTSDNNRNRTTAAKDQPPSPQASLWLACPTKEPSKHAYERFVALYTPVWIAAFGAVVVLQLYEDFSAWSYLLFTGALASPLILQPILFPGAGCQSPDAQRPLLQRYSFKANLWIAVYAFIGNYWYTHYFYSVLGASYTMPSHRLNNIPLAMFVATHFYFSTYHLFSNMLLRHISTRYQPNWVRSVLFVSTIVIFSYFTAFMETLTISSYPYYTFQDRDMAYTVGSAFYGIYFLVSFPAFYYFDSSVDQEVNASGTKATVLSAWDAFVNSCGYGMIILFLLDFVRLYLDIPLIVGRDPRACRVS